MRIRQFSSLLIVALGAILVLVALLFSPWNIRFVLLVLGGLVMVFGLIRLLVRLLNIAKRIDGNTRTNIDLTKGSHKALSLMDQRVRSLEKYASETRRLVASVDSRTRTISASGLEQHGHLVGLLETVGGIKDLSMKSNTLLASGNKSVSVISAELEKLHKLTSTVDFRTRRIFEQTSVAVRLDDFTGLNENLSSLLERARTVERLNKLNTLAISDSSAQIGRGFSNLTDELYRVVQRLEKLEAEAQRDAVIQWQISHRTLLESLGVLSALSAHQGYLLAPEKLQEVTTKFPSLITGDLLMVDVTEQCFYVGEKLEFGSNKLYVLADSVGQQEIISDLLIIMNLNLRIVPVLNGEIEQIVSKRLGTHVDVQRILDLSQDGYVDLSRITSEDLH